MKKSKIHEFEANAYQQYLHFLDDEKQITVLKLLKEYRLNPTPKIMSQIESNFPLSIIKKVAIAKYKYEQSDANKSKEKEFCNENVIKNAEQEKKKIFFR